MQSGGQAHLRANDMWQVKHLYGFTFVSVEVWSGPGRVSRKGSRGPHG